MSSVIELERMGCRKFVCPNISLIDEKGKELGLRDVTIRKAKEIAVEYFRKTYHHPHYSSVKHVLPSMVYIASKLERDKIIQRDIAKGFDVSHCTINKWYKDVMKVLDIETLKKGKMLDIPVPEYDVEADIKIKFDSELGEIDKAGKVLSLKKSTIQKAKDLASQYFKTADFEHYRLNVRQLRYGFIYTASVIENDRRTQLEISGISGTSECAIGKWYHDVLRVLRLKIISHNMRTICVLEEPVEE
jgi:transcription initiation factor TFIIIB Brf1 subunit/transcription initiation factor TFIIB